MPPREKPKPVRATFTWLLIWLIASQAATALGEIIADGVTDGDFDSIQAGKVLGWYLGTLGTVVFAVARLIQRSRE